jgi:hypothetical protein
MKPKAASADSAMSHYRCVPGSLDGEPVMLVPAEDCEAPDLHDDAVGEHGYCPVCVHEHATPTCSHGPNCLLCPLRESPHVVGSEPTEPHVASVEAEYCASGRCKVCAPRWPSWCERHRIWDCDFRGPCGDLRFLQPVARAVAESNRSASTGPEGRRRDQPSVADLRIERAGVRAHVLALTERIAADQRLLAKQRNRLQEIDAEICRIWDTPYSAPSQEVPDA